VLENFLEKLAQILSGINPLIMFLLVIIIGMYMFWRGSSETRKDNSSIFDIFILSSLLGIVAGRISYIISNWSSFSPYMWYWLPYEKYADKIFLFRVLPWRFLRIWDWGIDILWMFVGFIIITSIIILFVKKWKWSHVFPTIFFTVQSMFSVAFILLGGLTKNNDWLIQGSIMLLLIVVLSILCASVKKVMIGKKEGKVLMILNIFFILLSSTYIVYSYLSTNITQMEKIGAITFGIWSLIGIIGYISDSKKDNVIIEKVSSVRVVSPIDVNQPIKLPK
jgi:hypothetical protein